MAKMKQSTIYDNYQKILKQNKGALFAKVDLHVHTPASGDAQAKNKYNFKFDIQNKPKSLQKAKRLAEKIVRHCIDERIRLIAITDHNTPGNPHPKDLTNTWYDLIRKAARGKDLCVLPGVEISTDDLHLLVILDPKDDPKDGRSATYTTHRINFLLKDCKFDLKEYGDYRATGMSSLFDVLQYLENLGASCVAIPAHIDGGKKAMLSVYKGPSNVFNKLLNHPNLNAVEIVKGTTPAKKKIGKKKVADYFDRLRDKNRSPLAYIQDSDGHAVEEIGKRFTYVRMGEPSFWSLKNSLEDPETRVRIKKHYQPDTSKTRILGISFARGRKWSHIAFNENLNCIIGKKRTKKSTIIDLILYGLARFGQEEKEEEQKLIRQKYSVCLFMGKNSDVFCYHRQSKTNVPLLFKLQGNSFVRFNGGTNLELPRKYNHKQLENIFSKETSLMNFLDRHIFTDKTIQSYIARRDKYMNKVKNRSLKDCKKTDIKRLSGICDRLFKRREKFINASLEKYGKKSGKTIFRVKIKKGRRSPSPSRIDGDYFLDRADMQMLVKSKYKRLKKLSIGEKNAAIMVLLMNQGAFGPLIIDEPEQYLDVSSITGILIPRMRNLKTRQQIICVTRDEHVLLSGDAENVIVAQSEKKIQTVSGDINRGKIQEQILEIFEGEKLALMDKNRKLGRILEI